MPKISVIVPVYKVEPYLHRCVDSILAQTFTDFELILVDDGSPDNCGAICDEYAAKDDRIVVIHQENGGISAARNAGIDWAFANSDSEWLSFVDSDDWVHRNELEALIIAADITNLPVSIVSYKKVNAEDKPDAVVWKSENVEVWETEKLFCEKNVEVTVPWGTLYRKALFEKLRYPVGKIHEDEFLTYRIIFQSEKVAYIPQPMYWYFQNDSGIMRSEWNVKRIVKAQAFKEQIDWFEKNGYADAYKTRIKSYAWIIDESIKKLKESTIRKKSFYIRKLKKELRSFIKTKRDIISPDSGETKWIFQIAYPTEMKVRRFFRRKITAVQALGVSDIVKRVFRM